MVKKIYIPESLQNSKWKEDAPDNVAHRGLKFVDLDRLKSWVVKLEFKNNGSDSVGSGFFVNIPGALYKDKPCDVIFTAAHNFINESGKRTTDLTVHLNETTSLDFPDNSDQLFWCAEYGVKQTDETDYGAILVPKEKSLGGGDPFGFGFSTKLAYEHDLKGDIFVSGYQETTPRGDPILSSGECVACYPEQLEYRSETEQGVSGSAVWFEFEREPTAVAIHNRRATGGGGSRGSRFTPKLLRDVFKWASVGEYGVKVAAVEQEEQKKQKQKPPKLPSGGLFLSFREGFPFARVRLSTGTIFDVLPVHTDSVRELYALFTTKTKAGEKTEGKWVLFNTGRNEVVLSDDLKEACLFSKANFKKKDKRMRIMVETAPKRRFQLRLCGDNINEFDGEDAESSDVSLVNYSVPTKEEQDAVTAAWLDFRFE